MAVKKGSQEIYNAEQAMKRRAARRAVLSAMDQTMLALGRFEEALTPTGAKYMNVVEHCRALDSHINAVFQTLHDVDFDDRVVPARRSRKGVRR